MERLFIGTNYTGQLRIEEGFKKAPYVVLRRRGTDTFFGVQAEIVAETEDKECTFTFPYDVTIEMQPGTYEREVYVDDTMQDMLKYKEGYVKAIRVAASVIPEEEQQEQEPANG